HRRRIAQIAERHQRRWARNHDLRFFERNDARNRPTPADIASFRFCGIALMMYSRMRKIEIKKKITPEQNTAASACCQVYFIVKTTVKAKNALSPMPGASAIG